jgi:hypothetical protein
LARVRARPIAIGSAFSENRTDIDGIPELTPMESPKDHIMTWPGLILFIAVANGVIFGILGSWVAGTKTRDKDEGFLLGFLFGPFVVLIEALLPIGVPKPPRAQNQADIAIQKYCWVIIIVIGGAVAIALLLHLIA